MRFNNSWAIVVQNNLPDCKKRKDLQALLRNTKFMELYQRSKGNAILHKACLLGANLYDNFLFKLHVQCDHFLPCCSCQLF